MVKNIILLLLFFPAYLCAQINTERVMTIARNALYFEDYVLSIQYFNQVINAKPYLYEPYFFRGLAKINLEDYQGIIFAFPLSVFRQPRVVGVFVVLWFGTRLAKIVFYSFVPPRCFCPGDIRRNGLADGSVDLFHQGNDHGHGHAVAHLGGRTMAG